MRRAAICLAFACAACPSFHDLTGRSCTTDADCGDKLVCHRSQCAAAGSFETLDVDLTNVSSEGGADFHAVSLTRSRTLPGISALTPSTPLPHARTDAAAAATFVLGGTDGTTATADVFEIQSQASVTALPSARSALAAAWAPGSILALGGKAQDGTPLADVVSAQRQTDGGLGTWRSESPLPTARHGLSAVVAGGFVYALGGETTAGLSDDLLAAPIFADGTLGAWQPAGHLPDGRARAGVAVFERNLYLVGGACSGATCDVLWAPLLPDGGVGVFQSLAPLSARQSPTVIAAAGALTVIGGRLADGSLLDDVVSLALCESGSADWLPQPSLPQRLAGAVAVETPGGITLIGGSGPDGGALAQQLTASTTASGIGPFDEGPSYPMEAEQAVAVVWNAAVYVIGGVPHIGGPYDTIYRAALAPDGGLTDWTLAGTMPSARADVGALAWGGHLYLVGGCDGDDCLSISDVLVGDFVSDGGLENFHSIATLSNDTSGPAVLGLDGVLYAAGGVHGYNPTLDDVLEGAIDPAAGALGVLAPTAMLPFNPGVWGHGSAVMRGALYIVGGQATGGFGGYSDQVLIGTVNGDGTVAGWSASTSLPEIRGYTKAVAFDDTLYAVGGCNESPGSYCDHLLTSVPAAAMQPDGGLSPFASQGDLPRPRRTMATESLGGRIFTATGYDGNAHDWVDLTRMHGRGQLGAPQELAAAAGATVFAADDHWVFALGSGTTQQAPLTNGVPGAWTNVGALPAAATTAATFQGRLYAVAGTAVASAEISATGLGPWRNEAPLASAGVSIAAGPNALYVIAGTSVFVGPAGWSAGPLLPVAAERAAVGLNHLYAIGGPDGDVFVCAISPTDGSLAAWRRADSLAGPRDDFGAAIADGMLYVAGGTGFQDLQVTSLHADGSLSTWSTVAAVPTAHALVATPGYLLAYGDDARALPRLTPPSRGAISIRVDLGSFVSQVETVSLSGAGPFFTEVRLADAGGVFGPWMTLGAGTTVPIAQPARGLWLRVTLEDDALLEGLSVSTKL